MIARLEAKTFKHMWLNFRNTIDSFFIFFLNHNLIAILQKACTVFLGLIFKQLNIVNVFLILDLDLRYIHVFLLV